MNKLKRAKFDFKMTEEELQHQKGVHAKSLLEKDYLICTTCGADLKEYCRENLEVPKHPLLGVPYCDKCCGFYTSGEFSCDEDGEEKYCRWCGQGGTIFMCSSCTCGFCPSCIEKNSGKKALEYVEACEEWDCLICDVSPLWKLRHFVIFASRDLAAFAGKLNEERTEEELKFSELFRQKYKEIFEPAMEAVSENESLKSTASVSEGKRKERKTSSSDSSLEKSRSSKGKFGKLIDRRRKRLKLKTETDEKATSESSTSLEKLDLTLTTGEDGSEADKRRLKELPEKKLGVARKRTMQRKMVARKSTRSSLKKTDHRGSSPSKIIKSATEPEPNLNLTTNEDKLGDLSISGSEEICKNKTATSPEQSVNFLTAVKDSIAAGLLAKQPFQAENITSTTSTAARSLAKLPFREENVTSTASTAAGPLAKLPFRKENVTSTASTAAGPLAKLPFREGNVTANASKAAGPLAKLPFREENVTSTGSTAAEASEKAPEKTAAIDVSLDSEPAKKKPRLNETDLNTSEIASNDELADKSGPVIPEDTSGIQDRSTENDWDNDSTDVDDEIEEQKQRALTVKSLEQMIELIDVASNVSIGTLKKATERCRKRSMSVDRLQERVNEVIKLMNGAIVVLKSFADEDLKHILEKRED